MRRGQENKQAIKGEIKLISKSKTNNKRARVRLSRDIKEQNKQQASKGEIKD
jgi:hypothetical protein